ncbi:hypothetical protein [Cupriavidus basilensis]
MDMNTAYDPEVRMHCSQAEVVYEIAYAFRDDHYFFLKIRAAFPGVRR